MTLPVDRIVQGDCIETLAGLPEQSVDVIFADPPYNLQLQGDLYRVITSSTNPGDIILDPFFGSGTTGAVAKKLRRHWIGIERDPKYVQVAQARIDAVVPASDDEAVYRPSNKPREPRIAFVRLLEAGLLQPGQELRLGKTDDKALVTADGALMYAGQRGSIHQIGTQLMGAPCNGWAHWHYWDEAAGEWLAVDVLRKKLRDE